MMTTGGSFESFPARQENGSSAAFLTDIMSRILNVASVAAVALTAASMLVLAEPGFASDISIDASATTLLPSLVDDSVDASNQKSTDIEHLGNAESDKASDAREMPDMIVEPEEAPITASTLAELVAATPQPDKIDSELRCLAGAVYFESRGESLAGQLAVARVIINRAESGRYPDSYCGVVTQRSQFSFVRGGKMPKLRESGRPWANALAIAQIARANSWKNKAPGALYFHARYVSPRWRKIRVAQIDNHIFYR